MRKTAFCTCENKGVDELHGNGAADQCFCFHNMESITPLLSKSEISSLLPLSVAVQPVCVRLGWKSPRIGCVVMRLK